MTEFDQKQLGKTLWNIADTLRGAMNADDFRDYMLYLHSPANKPMDGRLPAERRRD